MRCPRPHVRRGWLALTLAMALLVPPGSGAGAVRASSALQSAVQAERSLQARIATERSQLARLRSDASGLASQIDAATRSIDQINVDQATVRANLNTASAALDLMRTRYLALVGQVNQLDAELQGLGLDLAEAQGQLASTRTDLSADIVAAYEAAQTPLLDQLLSARSFTTVLADVANYLQAGGVEVQLARQVQQEAASVEQLIQTTQAARASAQQARLALYAEKSTMQKQQDALAAADRRLATLEARSKAAQAAQLTTYKALKQERSRASTTLADEEAALGRLRSRIDALAGAGSIPSQYNGTLVWPMDGVVTQEFGCTGFYLEAPLGNCPHFHLGIDIAAPMDTPIRAAGDGTVLFVGPNPYDPPGERAWIVIIAHSQHLLTWYAHLDDGTHGPLVRKGELVRQGQVIGYEGNTGISTGPHLLWMVELNGQFVNPRLFV